MKRIVHAINNMNFDEIKELQKDIKNKNTILTKLIWQRLQELSNYEKFCTTCFKELVNPKYTLIIGDKLKRKLSFCEDDCFQHFITAIQTEKRKEEIKQMN